MSGLENSVLFSGLSRAELAFLRGSAVSLSRRAGELLFAEGAEGAELFVVLSGRVSVTVGLPDGSEVAVAEVGPGGYFGEMCLVERSRRSANCRCVEDSSFIELGAAAFDCIEAARPALSAKLLRRMMEVNAGRLAKTGGFLSDLVRWGESARKRATTDEATGLYNRRFHDDAFESLFRAAALGGKSIAYAMFDLDRFGTLNKVHGTAFGDQAILAAAQAMKQAFAADDIIVRFGGDEFVFILPGADPAAAHERCERLRALVERARVPGYPDAGFTCSVGTACYPDHSHTPDLLRAAADKALYRAKESGRNRVMLAGELVPRTRAKKDFPTIAGRNRTIAAMLDVMDREDGFLLLGHQNPDEDCIASLVSFALILEKLDKRASIYLRRPLGGQYAYLAAICAFNKITLLSGDVPADYPFRVAVALDTPKPALVDAPEALAARLASGEILRMEVDHHLEGDAECFGDEGLRLISTASSSCELIGFIAFKLANDKVLSDRYRLVDLFSRNLVLALLTGIVSDTRLGAYLTTKRDKRVYEWITGSFDRMLAEQTRSGSGNFSTKEELFEALEKLSSGEERCRRHFLDARRRSARVDWTALGEAQAAELRAAHGDEALVAAAKAVADALAEENGYLSLVAYPDGKGLVQFRLRRDRLYGGVDLRELLARLEITDGGGHPGAVGFRLPEAEVPDAKARADGLALRIGALVDAAEAPAGADAPADAPAVAEASARAGTADPKK